MRYEIIIKGPENFRIFDKVKKRMSRERFYSKKLVRIARQNKVLEDKWKAMFKVDERDWSQKQVNQANKLLSKIDENNLILASDE